MTPERLREIRAMNLTPTAPAAAFRDLLAYIDLLHEDLRITREERDAEKQKAMQRTKDHAREEADVWAAGYTRGSTDTAATFLGKHNHPAGANPYRLDIQDVA